MQSTPSITRADVLRVLVREFPEGDGAALMALLDEYGVESWQRDRERVQMAILKLAAGDRDQLRHYVQSAKEDYRDVLAWAESPGYAREVPGPARSRRRKRSGSSMPTGRSIKRGSGGEGAL